MTESVQQAAGWMITGFQSLVFLAGWIGAVLVYALLRSLGDAEPDPIRSAGPLD